MRYLILIRCHLYIESGSLYGSSISVLILAYPYVRLSCVFSDGSDMWRISHKSGMYVLCWDAKLGNAVSCSRNWQMCDHTGDTGSVRKRNQCQDYRRYRADSRFAPSQWETALQSNVVSHWLGTNLESALRYISESGQPYKNSVGSL